jgi:hypothetical protein
MNILQIIGCLRRAGRGIFDGNVVHGAHFFFLATHPT